MASNPERSRQYVDNFLDRLNVPHCIGQFRPANRACRKCDSRSKCRKETRGRG